MIGGAPSTSSVKRIGGSSFGAGGGLAAGWPNPAVDARRRRPAGKVTFEQRAPTDTRSTTPAIAGTHTGMLPGRAISGRPGRRSEPLRDTADGGLHLRLQSRVGHGKRDHGPGRRLAARVAHEIGGLGPREVGHRRVSRDAAQVPIEATPLLQLLDRQPFEIGDARAARQRARRGGLGGVVTARDEGADRGRAEPGVLVVEPPRHGVGRRRGRAERHAGAQRRHSPHAAAGGFGRLEDRRRQRLRLEPRQRVGDDGAVLDEGARRQHRHRPLRILGGAGPTTSTRHSTGSSRQSRSSASSGSASSTRDSGVSTSRPRRQATKRCSPRDDAREARAASDACSSGVLPRKRSWRSAEARAEGSLPSSARISVSDGGGSAGRAGGEGTGDIGSAGGASAGPVGVSPSAAMAAASAAAATRGVREASVTRWFRDPCRGPAAPARARAAGTSAAPTRPPIRQCSRSASPGTGKRPAGIERLAGLRPASRPGPGGRVPIRAMRTACSAVFMDSGVVRTPESFRARGQSPEANTGAGAVHGGGRPCVQRSVSGGGCQSRECSSWEPRCWRHRIRHRARRRRSGAMRELVAEVRALRLAVERTSGLAARRPGAARARPALAGESAGRARAAGGSTTPASARARRRPTRPSSRPTSPR